MMNTNIDQALQQLQQAQNDPQTLTLATAQIACAPLHPELFEILQVAALPHWFDAEILAHLLQINTHQANDWLELLMQLPMVESYHTRSAWNVHETTRLALRASLAAIDLERFRELSGLCADYFSSSEEIRQIERVYHLLGGMTAGADQTLLTLYQGWRNSGRYDAQQTLGFALAELLDSKLLSGVNLARCLVIHGWIRRNRIPLEVAETQARQALDLFLQAEDEYGENDVRDWLGDILTNEGKLQEALHQFQTGLRLMLRLTEQNPENSDWLRDLSVLHNKIGNVFQDQGKLTAAFQEYLTGIDIMFLLTERDPENSDWQRSLALSHSNVGGALQAMGNSTEALREYRAYMDIMCQLAERDPDNSSWQRDLSLSHICVGSILQAQRNLAEALREYWASMDIMLSLTKRDPDNSGWFADLSLSHNMIGNILYTQGNLAGALREYRAFKDIMSFLSKRDPNNTESLRGLSVSHCCIATILEAQDLLTEAVIERQADLAIIKHLAQLDITNQKLQQDLQASRDALAALKQRITEAGN